MPSHLGKRVQKAVEYPIKFGNISLDCRHYWQGVSDERETVLGIIAGGGTMPGRVAAAARARSREAELVAGG